MRLRKHNNPKAFVEHKHDGLLLFVCFMGSALAGYLLGHLTSILH